MVSKLIKKQVEAFLPNAWGNFKISVYSDDVNDQRPHIVLMHEKCDPSKSVVVRVHSECLTGDLFHSQRCDCGEQLDQAMSIIGREQGVLIYMRQEGRGIGLINKLKAYNLQDKGLNTMDANIHLGFQVDEREYQIALAILKDLDINSIKLITNNPDKIKAIEESNIDLHSRIPIVISPQEGNKKYLQVKQDLMGHMLGNE
jgi:3,4-dihydroxy 2-butanone 4-phosphate synthase/GTP cyclohydrolase II